MEFLFHFSAFVVLPFWAIMIFCPHSWKITRVIHSPWIILPSTICYVIVLLPNLNQAMLIFHDPSPALMARIGSEQWAASLVWIAAGAFDLFVGRWIYFDAQSHAISRWFVSPILFVCIFFGPLGFFFYAVLKGVYFLTRAKTIQSKNEAPIL